MSDYYRRADYWSKGSTIGRSTPNPIVLGRRFCACCHHWRHVCDFRRDRANRRSGLRSYCECCDRIHKRQQRARHTAVQRDRVREYQRIWREVQRRRAGILPRVWQRPTVIDRKESVFLPPGPLVALLDRHVDELASVAAAAGVPERSILRLRTGESAHVRLDLADRLALAAGSSLWALYGDTPLQRFDPSQNRWMEATA